MTQLRSAVAVALLCGCTLPNPAFNDRGAGDGDTGDGDQGDGDPSTGDDDPGTGDGDGDTTTGPGTTDTGDESTDTGDACPPALTDCDGQCIDLTSDNSNCGMCGKACGDHEVCLASDCVPVKYVFVTSVPGNGQWGGLEGAAQLCGELAGNANLPGDYAPWLSTADEFPAKTYSQIGPYVRTDRVIVASSWEDLTDGTIDAPIDRDESGAPIQPSPAPGCQLQYAVWTGTTNEGEYTEPNCGDWDIDASQQSKDGVVGDAKSQVAWSTGALCAQHCSAELPVYCVQQ
ncbi:hypothetical protein [Enhygromyxa salina]|uniref:Uncharacterized protein n=1 Tax=Enhygromyxa salina TaxID=215803 RepID=A0A2S9XLX2_9BACT|nr:hypothetical protein [Enhygromyxa salina]PRP93681.1 hypothetical protein ENSA7_81090 [Enhygromyxa salina]